MAGAKMMAGVVPDSRILPALALFAAACSGKIGTTGGGSSSNMPPSPPGSAPSIDGGGLSDGATPAGDSGPLASADAGGLGPAVMRRLTPTEYWNSATDLLGLDDTLSRPDIEDVGALSGFKNIAASSLTISAQGVEQYENAALSITRPIFADATKRGALLGCQPTAAADPCVRAFLQTFGRRAWRRPLTSAEIDRYQAIVTNMAAMADVWTGLQYAVAGLLQSPWFLYRVEIGEPDPARRFPVRYSAYEMAGRLAYFLWDTTPDDTLLDAAARGDTLTDAGLQAAAARLLTSPRAQAGVSRFFGEYLETDGLDTLTKDATVFPKATATLAAAMRAEIQATLGDLVFTRRADIRDLLDNRQTFVNAELGALYGIGGITGAAMKPVTLPDAGPRQGILGFAGFLAMNARTNRTSPTLRGRFVRQQLLCEPVAPPPANFAATFDAPSGTGATTQTLRQRLVQHMSDTACSGCHALMDPLGFAFEHFDALGAYRANEGGKPIDDSGSVNGHAFTGPRELAGILRQMPEVTSCLTRQIYRYATGRLETGAESPIIDGIGTRASASGNAFLDYLGAVAASDGFRFAAGAP
jgi:hypothetical protein